MKNTTKIVISVISVLGCLSGLGACADQSSEQEIQVEEHTEAHTHAGFPHTVEVFHDVMSVDWHADAGTERMQATCANVGDYAVKALAVTKAPSPKNVSADAWDLAATGLLGAVKTLEDQGCVSHNTEQFQKDFTSVHDRFHDLKTLLDEAK